MQASPLTARSDAGSGAVLPMCYHCSSTESMEPQGRAAAVPVLTRLIPGLRWRFCRHCHRHFLTLRRTRHRA